MAPTKKTKAEGKPKKPRAKTRQAVGTAEKDETSSAKAATPATPGALRIRIKLKAYDHKLLDQSAKQVVDAVVRDGAKVSGPVPLPTAKRMYTVNRSTFVHKNARDQYEIRVHKRLIDITQPTSKTVDTLMSLNLPAGVDVSMRTGS